MKSLPEPGTKTFDDLIDWEEEKIKGGVNLYGVHITGWLYWHLNHWMIRVDAKDAWGNNERIPSRPMLRDNEWIRAEHLERCRTENGGYMEVGARQGGKSEMEASFFGMNAIMFRNTQNVIVCGNDTDLSLLKDKVDFGLKNVWEGLNIPRIDKTWTKNQIRLGYKKPDGEDEIWSYIMIRNAKDGHNTEAPAGTTAKSFIMDEVGKYLFAETYKAGEPALKGEYGFRAIPILVGTGGSFDNGKDAENFFFNPRANNFTPVVDPVSGEETCLFLSGLYRMDCKRNSSLGEFLKTERGMDVPEDSPLYGVPMKVSDKKLAWDTIIREREDAKLNPDGRLYLKQKMYYPLTVKECFLSSSRKLFETELVHAQLERLKKNPPTYVPVFLHHDGEKIVHSFTEKQPIKSFPHKEHDDLDAPILIYEFPVQNPPYGLYVAGVDPYRQANSKYSNSLGAVYIYKRMNSITGEKYQNMFVASYTARPKDKKKWEKQAQLLIKMYNARTLCENDEISFIDHMIAEGDAHFLEKQPDWLREIVPNTRVDREYGIHRSADKIREFLHTTYKKYMEQKIYVEKDAEGNVLREVFGVSRILDPVLCEETAQCEEEGNYDRVVAAELAIALAAKMDPVYGEVKQPLETKKKKTTKKSTLFVSSTQNMNYRRNKLFT